MQQIIAEIGDTKLPVSLKLLEQLCEAADLLFDHYNATLVKCMFQAAFGCCLRISEYSMAHTKRCHNLRAGSLGTTPKGLAVEFFSDKTSHFSPCVKHKEVPWKCLPRGAKQLFEEYERIRPKDAEFHFVRIDRWPLTRKNVTDWLDVCAVGEKSQIGSPLHEGRGREYEKDQK